MLPFFFIFFRDSQTGTKRFRLILDIFSLIHGKLDELVSSTETWYDKSFPDMFRIACSSMALGSIACRRLQLSIVTKYCISLPISVIFRFLKAFYSGTSFDFQSSCSACYHETTEILAGLIHIKWKLFTSISTPLLQLLYNAIHILTVFCILCIYH